MAKLAAGIKAGKAKAAAIAAATAKAAKKLAADHKKINADYKATTDKLAAKNKADLAALDKQQKKYADEEAATDKKNKDSAAADQAAIKSAEKHNKATDKKEKGALAKTAAKEAASKKKAEAAYQKKKAAADAALKAKRGKEADKKRAIAAKADAVYLTAKKEADVKEGKAKVAAKKEKASKAASAKKLKAEEKQSKIPPAEIPTCGPGQCLDKKNKCQDTNGVSAPFMGSDLVHCADKAPAMEPYSGMSWAPIPPPPPPPPVVPSAKCVALKKACAKKKDCDALLKMDSIKATEKAGCGKSKDLLDEWFAITSERPNTKYPGFQDNIPMWKEQITDMPVYKDSGTTGRFKANRGAGSICNMVKELVGGFAAGFPDSSSAPVAKTVYGSGKWDVPAAPDGFKGAEFVQAEKGE